MTKPHEKRAAVTPITNHPHISNQPRFNAANVDSSQGLAQSFATSGHIPIGFDDLKTLGNSNAALLLHTTAAFLLSVFWLNQLVSQIREAFKSASFLVCWFVNLYLARLFRLTTIKASTSTLGAN